MLYKVSEFVLFICSTFLVLVSLFRGVPCSFTHVCCFRLTLSLSFRRLFGARQSTAGVLLAHVVMSSPANTNTAPLAPNVVIANEVHDAVEVDHTDHVEFDLDELKEHPESTVFLKSSTTLLQSSVAGKLLGLSSLVQRLKIQSPLPKPPKGFLTPRSQ